MDDLQYPMSCPFCGGWPLLKGVGGKGMLAAVCTTCGAQGPPKYIPGDAMRAWDEIRFRRRMTDRDLGGPDNDPDPEPKPSPIKPKTPEFA